MKEQTKYEEKKINRTSDFFELIHLDRFLISNVLLAYVFDGSSRLSFARCVRGSLKNLSNSIVVKTHGAFCLFILFIWENMLFRLICKFFDLFGWRRKTYWEEYQYCVAVFFFFRIEIFFFSISIVHVRVFFLFLHVRKTIF